MGSQGIGVVTQTPTLFVVLATGFLAKAPFLVEGAARLAQGADEVERLLVVLVDEPARFDGETAEPASEIARCGSRGACGFEARRIAARKARARFSVVVAKRSAGG
jgi:hypothetical protein